MTSFRQKLKSKLGEFASILQVGNFLYKNYLSRSLIAVILSFFSCLSETIGVLTIIPVFLIISGEPLPDSGYVSTIYEYFSEMGLTDNLITILIFFILAITLKSLLKLINSYLIGDTFALIAKEYRLKVMDAIYKAEWNYFVTQKTGSLANSISSEPEKARQAFNYFIKFVNAFVQLCFYLFISFAASTIVTFSAFIYAILLFLIIGIALPIGLKALIIPQTATLIGNSSTGIAHYPALNPANHYNANSNFSFSNNNWFADLKGQKISLLTNSEKYFVPFTKISVR